MSFAPHGGTQSFSTLEQREKRTLYLSPVYRQERPQGLSVERQGLPFLGSGLIRLSGLRRWGGRGPFSCPVFSKILCGGGSRTPAACLLQIAAPPSRHRCVIRLLVYEVRPDFAAGTWGRAGSRTPWPMKKLYPQRTAAPGGAPLPRRITAALRPPGRG